MGSLRAPKRGSVRPPENETFGFQLRDTVTRSLAHPKFHSLARPVRKNNSLAVGWLGWCGVGWDNNVHVPAGTGTALSSSFAVYMCMHATMLACIHDHPCMYLCLSVCLSICLSVSL